MDAREGWREEKKPTVHVTRLLFLDTFFFIPSILRCFILLATFFFFFLRREFVKESLVVKRRGEILGISEYTRLKESCLLKIDMNI